ncbi:MAG: ABC transporter permease [Patescibacteria group bacterium]|nr:ABC transporter permease [Patescibacteria group bacterium]
MAIIYILWLRQIKRFFRSKARIIGSIGQPLLFLVALGFGMGPIFEKAGEGNYIYFLSPGIIVMTILFSSIFTGVDIIWDRQFGFLKETLVAPVSRFKIVLGRILGGATTSLLQGVIVLIITIPVGFRFDIAMLPLALLFMFLIAIFFTTLGTTIGSMLKDMQAFHLIMNFLVMPIFFLSGALFPIEHSVGVLEIITKLNPLAYGVDGVRGSLTSNFYFSAGTDLIVLFIASILILLLSSYIFSKIEA